MIEEVETSKEKKATEAFVILKINNKKVKVKLDTGAEVNVMPLRVYEQLQTVILKPVILSLKIVSATFSLVYFLSLTESTCETKCHVVIKCLSMKHETHIIE